MLVSVLHYLKLMSKRNSFFNFFLFFTVYLSNSTVCFDLNELLCYRVSTAAATTGARVTTRADVI